jgi:predicted component of type VI protein secretion system
MAEELTPFMDAYWVSYKKILLGPRPDEVKNRFLFDKTKAEEVAAEMRNKEKVEWRPVMDTKEEKVWYGGACEVRLREIIVEGDPRPCEEEGVPYNMEGDDLPEYDPIDGHIVDPRH